MCVIIIDPQSLSYSVLLSVFYASSLRHYDAAQCNAGSFRLRETLQVTASSLDYTHIFSSSHQKIVSGGTHKNNEFDFLFSAISNAATALQSIDMPE